MENTEHKVTYAAVYNESAHAIIAYVEIKELLIETQIDLTVARFSNEDDHEWHVFVTGDQPSLEVEQRIRAALSGTNAKEANPHDLEWMSERVNEHVKRADPNDPFWDDGECASCGKTVDGKLTAYRCAECWEEELRLADERIAYDAHRAAFNNLLGDIEIDL